MNWFFRQEHVWFNLGRLSRTPSYDSYKDPLIQAIYQRIDRSLLPGKRRQLKFMYVAIQQNQILTRLYHPNNVAIQSKVSIRYRALTHCKAAGSLASTRKTGFFSLLVRVTSKGRNCPLPVLVSPIERNASVKFSMENE